MRFSEIPGGNQQQGEFKVGQAIQETAKDLTQTEALQAPEERNLIFSSLGERVAGIHLLPYTVQITLKKKKTKVK